MIKLKTSIFATPKISNFIFTSENQIIQLGQSTNIYSNLNMLTSQFKSLANDIILHS